MMMKDVCFDCIWSNHFWDCCMNRESPRFSLRRYDIKETEACNKLVKRS